jgi:hypothetical protein
MLIELVNLARQGIDQLLAEQAKLLAKVGSKE